MSFRQLYHISFNLFLFFMRQFSEITEAEMVELWELILAPIFGSFTGSIVEYKEDNRGLPRRRVLMQGVERLGVYDDGNVWADSDLEYISYDRRLIFDFFIDKGFYIPSKGYYIPCD